MPSQFAKKTQIDVNGTKYEVVDISAVANEFNIEALPFSIRILLENQLRHLDEKTVTTDDVKALAGWIPDNRAEHEIAFSPARVVLQDFTGVPAIVDLAAMRDAVTELGGNPLAVNPRIPVELVIDHSVMVDHFGTPAALNENTDIEFERNRERYEFLRWGQKAFDNFKVVPPGTGIVHQVNLEYLARGVFDVKQDGVRTAYFDTLVGTDSHTTMINGIGVLGWGVGGIEAEAAMLGQPLSMLIPDVIGFKLTGQMQAGLTATDLVLTVTEILRELGVVGKFVEFFGEGVSRLPLADRATIANMAPEYGATCGYFPIDKETIRYLETTGRTKSQCDLVEAYSKKLLAWYEPDMPDPQYTQVVTLDLGTVEKSLAGPKRPQDRIPLSQVKSGFEKSRLELINAAASTPPRTVDNVQFKEKSFSLEDGAVVIAAITSCTNTSNPSVMLGAGLLAKKAIEKGLNTKPWVKTSLAPGSQVVPEYLNQAGLTPYLEKLGFYLVGFGCTTCIGNSGPLPAPIVNAIHEKELTVCSVLSGNRNFEGRIHSEVKANYLASPPMVVAYAIAGSMNIDLDSEAIGTDAEGKPVYLKDIWPSQEEIDKLRLLIDKELFTEKYASVFEGSPAWNALPVSDTPQYPWPKSTYIKKPPFFDGMSPQAQQQIPAIESARCLVKLGDSVTTDHISPAGSIKPSSPAGLYLQAEGVLPQSFNSYGSRRGNHEVMMRGTFANIRLRNQLAPGKEGSWTTYFPSDEQISIFDAAMKYAESQTPLIVLAGKEYGTGSSRDWAAKGTTLLGVKAVIAQSYERIHRSNLVGMGVLPLQFMDGESAETLNLTGTEIFSIPVIAENQDEVAVSFADSKGQVRSFTAQIRIDTPVEFQYYLNNGILPYVVRDLSQH
ncbi:MAG: aconitate hydratase AcnA [Gammaproteobacteria bacterium]|nr:aconitate hydratase AcnA [Gammaproteobacteria bacterium]